VLAVTLVPAVVLLTISYFQAIHRTQDWLRDNIDTATRRTDRLLEAAETILTRIGEDTEGRVSPETFNLIRRYVYTDPRFREAGIIDEKGFLVLTSLGPVNPPIPVLPQHRLDPKRKSLQIIGPVKTAVMKERSMILSLPIPKQGEANLMVDPVVFTYFLEDSELGDSGFIVFVGPEGQVLTGVGALPSDPQQWLTKTDGSSIQVRRSTKNGEITIIGSVPTQWALRYWTQDLITGGLLAFFCSGLAIVLFLRFARRAYGIEHDLRLGLENHEFEVHYQPIVDLETERCVGSEALVRWQHPDLGLIYPGVFIPIAEKTGLIKPLSEWIIRQVIQDQADLLTQSPNLYVSINLPPALLMSEEFLDRVIQLLTASGFPTRQMMFEVTENDSIDRLHATNMARLRRLGVWFALDDFGTGYSNLNYLNEFQFEYLKIDRCFIQRIQPGETNSPICDTVIELGQKLELQMVAEGVETQEQCQYLRQAGVRYVQGWLFAKAMPLHKFKQFLQ
jgi:sensor c-di-GMP phosphodiesterase-like protein